MASRNDATSATGAAAPWGISLRSLRRCVKNEFQDVILLSCFVSHEGTNSTLLNYLTHAETQRRRVRQMCGWLLASLGTPRPCVSA